MALQNFVDKVGPVVSAAWLNMVDVLSTTVFQNASSGAAARSALCTDAPLEIVNGGTGGRTGSTARTALFTDAPLEVTNGGTGSRLVRATGSTAASASITTSETYITPVPLPLDTLVAGSTFRLTIFGSCTCTHSADLTTLNVRIGTAGSLSDTAFVASSISSQTGAVGNGWCQVVLVNVRTAGVSGSIVIATAVNNTASVGLYGNVALVLTQIPQTFNTTTPALFLGASLVTNAATTSHVIPQWTIERVV